MEILERAWIVVPAYCESHVLREVIERLHGICPRIVVVDDGSNDETGAVFDPGDVAVGIFKIRSPQWPRFICRSPCKKKR